MYVIISIKTQFLNYIIIILIIVYNNKEKCFNQSLKDKPTNLNLFSDFKSDFSDIIIGHLEENIVITEHLSLKKKIKKIDLYKSKIILKYTYSAM